jgi:hypothetical protein
MAPMTAALPVGRARRLPGITLIHLEIVDNDRD